MKTRISIINQLSHGVSILFCVVSLEAIYAIAWQTRARFTKDESSLYDPIALITFGVILVMLFFLRNYINRIIQKIALPLSKGTDRQWISTILFLGILLRTTYLFFFFAPPVSDGSNYIHLAYDLLEKRPYEIGGTYSYWPPGYPIFLTGWFFIFSQSNAIFFSNTLLFLATGFCLYFVLLNITEKQSARIALLLFSFWPNLIALHGRPAKENLLIALVSIILFLFIKIPIGRMKAYLYFVAIGLLFGFVSLTQPGMLLLFFAVPLTLFLSGATIRVSFISLIMILFGMFIIISPWTYRNYKIWGEKVIITSNGGSNLYRANNPLADGRYKNKGEIDFSNLGELEQSRASYNAAIIWIKENPIKFILLSVKKQFLFLGDDGSGFYSSMKRGGGSNSNAVYFFAKAIGNFFWLILWSFLAYYSFSFFGIASSLTEIFSKIGILYLWGIHSFFESAPKYHLPVSTLLLALVAIGVHLNRKKS